MAIPRNLANLANQLNTDGEAPKIEVGDSSVAITDTGSNGTITFTTDNSERMRVTAAGNVGIGKSSYTSMTTNGAWFDIGIFTHISNTSNTNATLFLNQNGTGAMQEWRLANDVKGTFNQYGLGLGTAVPQSGIGICFPGTQSASSNGNTLDDYEEGTWTPTFKGAGTAGTYTLSGTAAKYTKIGNLVTVTAYFAFSAASGGSAYAIMAGLPFPSDVNTPGSVVFDSVDLDAACIHVNCLRVSNAQDTSLYFPQTRDNAVSLELAVSGFTTSSSVFLTYTYPVK